MCHAVGETGHGEEVERHVDQILVHARPARIGRNHPGLPDVTADRLRHFVQHIAVGGAVRGARRQVGAQAVAMAWRRAHIALDPVLHLQHMVIGTLGDALDRNRITGGALGEILQYLSPLVAVLRHGQVKHHEEQRQRYGQQQPAEAAGQARVRVGANANFRPRWQGWVHGLYFGTYM